MNKVIKIISSIFLLLFGIIFIFVAIDLFNEGVGPSLIGFLLGFGLIVWAIKLISGKNQRENYMNSDILDKKGESLKQLNHKLKLLEKDHLFCKNSELNSEFKFFNLILLWMILSIVLGVILLSMNLLYKEISIYPIILFWIFISFIIGGGYKNKEKFREWILDKEMWTLFLIVIISFLSKGVETMVFLTLIYSIYSDYKTRKIKREWEKLTFKINHLGNLKKQKAKQRRENKEKLARKRFAKSQREKGLELFEEKWVDKKEIPKLKEIQIGLDKNFQNLSPYEFEKFISKLFNAMGYETRVTQASNDYGIDVVAEKGNEKIAIQCKRYRPGNPVSNRDVQRLLGAMQLKNVQATHSILITTSHFTVQAREQAKECAIELWERHDLEKMVRKYLMKI